MKTNSLVDKLTGRLKGSTGLFSHPAEIAMLVYCATVLIVTIYTSVAQRIHWPMIVSPVCIAASYTLSAYRQRGLFWQLLYWLPLLLFVAALFMPFLEEWNWSTSYYITVFALVPLWILLRHFRVDNSDFAVNTSNSIFSLVGAVFIPGVTMGLVSLILWSIGMLFEVDIHENCFIIMAVVLFVLLAPSLFMAFENASLVDDSDKSVSDGFLINFILFPAIIIYTLVLYVYAAKILFTWTLPKGSVAVMVLVFCLVVMVIKLVWCMQKTEGKRFYDWFLKYFSFIALPLLVLFWIGVARRLSDYGLTPARYWLLFCGGLMTVCVLMFLRTNRRGYYILTAIAAVTLFLVAVFPSLTPENVSERSQLHRVRSIAAKVDRLSPDGKILLPPADISDTLYRVEYRKLYQSLCYLSSHHRNGDLLYDELGIEIMYDFRSSMSEPTRDYAVSDCWRCD